MPNAANAETRKLLVGSFQNIVINGDMQVDLVTRKGPSGKATGDRHILDRLKLERISETLYISVHQPLHNQQHIRMTEPLIISLTNHTLRDIILRGNGQLSVNELGRDGISKIHLDGGGTINIGQAVVDKLNISINGPGTISIAGGSAREINTEIRGTAIFDAANMETRKFTLNQNGNGQISANVAENATITNNGAGNIKISGAAECFIRRAGSAVISCPRDGKSKRRF